MSIEAALSHRMRGVGSPETEHENMAVDPTNSCWVVGIAITEGATRGRRGGGGAGGGWGGEQSGVGGGSRVGLGEGAVGVGVGEGGVERINQLTKYIHCQTTRTVSLLVSLTLYLQLIV